MGGTKNIIAAALASGKQPWILYASSREVYGEAEALPVPDTAPLNPLNVYSETKVICEEMILEARRKKLTTGVVRFSNVYGDPRDHVDRVIPAFCRTAARGGRSALTAEKTPLISPISTMRSAAWCHSSVN